MSVEWVAGNMIEELSNEVDHNCKDEPYGYKLHKLSLPLFGECGRQVLVSVFILSPVHVRTGVLHDGFAASIIQFNHGEDKRDAFILSHTEDGGLDGEWVKGRVMDLASKYLLAFKTMRIRVPKGSYERKELDRILGFIEGKSEKLLS